MKNINLLEGTNSDVITGGVPTIAGAVFPNTMSDPRFATDNLNTSWMDPELRPLLITFLQGRDVRKVCITLGRQNPAASIAVDAAMSTVGPWKLKIGQTPVKGDMCLLTDRLCTTDIIEPMISNATPFSIIPPGNFRLVETTLGSGVFTPVPCPEYGACLATNNTCRNFTTGPLCHQCTFAGRDGSLKNGTRPREGQVCEECPVYWLPWVKLVIFYLLAITFIGGVLYISFRATRAPLFSPAAMADLAFKEKDAKRYRKEVMLAEYRAVGKEPPAELLQLSADDHASEKEAVEESTSSLSPVLMAGLIRMCVDHHVLCCISWQYSGIALCWPEDVRPICFMVNMDWFNILSMECAGLTFFVDDLLFYGITAVPIQWLVFALFSWLVFNDKFGCCVKPEQALLTDKDALEEAFSRIDKDSDGKLTKKEILKAIEPPAELKRMPTPGGMVKAALVLFAFFHNPLYTRLFLVNLDCTTLGGVSLMRLDLREECAGSQYNTRVYISMLCFALFNIGTVMLSLFFIWKARQETKQSEDEDGYVTCDAESAFAFALAGLKSRCWWFSCWKMLLKEILPVIIIINRAGDVPTDPGVSDGPGELALLGLLIGFTHEHLHPWEHMYAFPLGTLERLTWCAFCAPPLCKLLIGNKVEVAMHLGTAVIGQWTKQAETGFQWMLLMLCLLLYFAPFCSAAYFLAGEELGFTKVHTINIEVAERIHITLPPKGRERRQLCQSLAKLFEHALLSVARMADEVDCPTLSPASTIEGALLIVMREDAAYWGDASAGTHPVLNVEHESVLGVIVLLQKDREKRDLGLSRAILDAGGLAETCLKQGIDIKGLKVNHGHHDDDGNALPPPSKGEDQSAANATVIALNYALENVELRSLGYKDGERLKADQIRPGIIRALVRSCAVAVACPEDHIEVMVHPVGYDRALVTVTISCGDLSELSIREDWLRTSLGTRESRNRWSKGVESDLSRVGAAGFEGQALLVRFSKGSKPQRTTPEGAVRIALAAVKAASQVDQPKPSDRSKSQAVRKSKTSSAQPTLIGSGSTSQPSLSGSGSRNSLLHTDHDNLDPFDNEGLGFAKVLSHAHQARPRSEGPSEGSGPSNQSSARQRGPKKGKGKGRQQAASAPLGNM